MAKPLKTRAWFPERQEMITTGYHIDPAGEAWLHIEEGFTTSYDLIVMTYIGLKDLNDTEIYESDVLEHTFDGSRFTVVWDEVLVSFRADYRDNSSNGSIPLQIGDRGLAIVVGNIYENPELLEEPE